MIEKLKKVYRKYFPKEIDFEGVYYDSKTGTYVASYFSPVYSWEYEIGRFDSLSKAVVAYDYYNKAVFDYRQHFKENFKAEISFIVDEMVKQRLGEND